MSGRRGGNRIRGPQSALTDFLAANNISAAQIRDDHERRLAQAARDANTGEGAANPTSAADDEEIAAAVAADVADEEERVETTKKRKRSEKNAIDNIKKEKASASKKKGAKGKKGKKKGPDDEDDDDDFDPEVAKDIYKKSRKLPGQFEHCEVCSKRFTVTPYSKAGPDGGLLCAPCGKDLAKDLKQEKNATASKSAGRKRRKLESDRLDGVASGGAKTLQQLCIAKVATHHEDIVELGDLPQPIIERLAEIFSKRRVMKPRTMSLFLRGDLDTVNIPDAAYLEEEDYHQIFAIVPDLEKLILQNTCQLKDKAIDYMIERCRKLRHLQLYAANLVSTDMWHKLFRESGYNLEVVKLKWLDAAFEDATISDMVRYSPNLKRVKFELCRRIGENAVAAMSDLPQLEYLSLQIGPPVSSDVLVDLITKRGAGLRTLSLKAFFDADDTVLDAIHNHCSRLEKLRISQNDTATDAGFVALFTGWQNPPLIVADFNSDRDVDNNNPNGPDEATGLACAGFKALMAHSGFALRNLNIASCRHIRLSAFMDAFNGEQQYPVLEVINLSFCNRIDNSVIAGIFKSCPALKKLEAFGCFSVYNISIPRNTIVVGVPTAQDSIEQYGVGIGVDEAIGRMVEAAA